VLGENAVAIAAATSAGLIASYAAGFRDRMDDLDAVVELALGCWLARRRRILHGRWLADVSAARPELVPPTLVAAFIDEVVPAWQRAGDYAYVAQRRVERGRRAPGAALDLLVTEVEPAEAALAERMLDRVATAPATAGRG
jgi:hypothetical protein